MFQKVEQADFLTGEHEVLRFWQEQDVFRRLLEQNRGKPKWSFLDGPITANNPMGVHHAWGRTYKDAYQRYFAMTGHELRYQNGFDCQGLWVEVEVEKELNLGTKTGIEEYGIDRFVHECKRRVLKFAARQTEQSVRLGYWMEWDDPDELRKLANGIGTSDDLSLRTPKGETASGPAEQLIAQLGNPAWGGSYFTFSTENNATIWAFLKKCFERGKVYRGHDVMPWSGRGGSAYSQMEVADGRKLTTHKSCFVRFPIIEKPASGAASAPRSAAGEVDAIGGLTPPRSPENEYLLVWTTTPWTLTANVAAAVNPDLEYVKIRTKRDGAIYYFAKENLNYKRLEKEFKEGFGRPEWQWPEGVPKLKTIAQIFKEQGGFEELGTIKGEEMIGWRYEGPFDDLPAQNEAGGYPNPPHAMSTVPCWEVLLSDEHSLWSMLPAILAKIGTLGAEAELKDAAWLESDSMLEEALEAFRDLPDDEKEAAIDAAVQSGELPGSDAADKEQEAIQAEEAFNLAFFGYCATWIARLRSEILKCLHDSKVFGLLATDPPSDHSFSAIERFLNNLGLQASRSQEWAKLKVDDEVASSIAAGVNDDEIPGPSAFAHEILECGRRACQLIRDDLKRLHRLSSAQSHHLIDGGRDSKGNPNVVAGEGTGIVHIAPGCGDIDHKIGVELGLPVIAPLKEDGTYDDGFGTFTGKEAIDPATAELVFDELKKKDLLVYVETYPHIYPHCWRTGDELVFRLVDEWFINMDWREEIKQVVKTIRWIPDSIQGQERELEWLETMRDWMISKKRFWGLALPVWVDPDNPSDFEVIGSLDELKERALDGGEGWEEFEGHTPHRPWIDKVKIKSRKTGKLLSRIEDVGNPWLDAGIVPFSTLNYNAWKRGEALSAQRSAFSENAPSTLNAQPSTLHWPDWFPADFVTECFPGQFRNWFYSLLALATMMRYDETDDPEEKRPFKNLLGHRLVMDEHGNPMHKSDGTAIWFEEAAEQLGVDTLRWMYLAQNPASDLRFGTRHPDEPVTLETPEGPISETKEGLPTCRVTSKPADEIRRQILIPLWNSYAFFVNYAVLDEFDPTLEQVPLDQRPEIDRWILSRLQELTRTAHESFEAYNVAEFMRAAEKYIDDLSNWYIRRNRRRFWRKKESGARSQEPGKETLKGEPHAVEMAAYRVYLSTQKLGLTRERTVVANEVFSSRERFDAEQILIRLSRFQKGKKVSRSTVYRTLEQLAAAGLIRSVAEGDEPALYDLVSIAEGKVTESPSADGGQLAPGDSPETKWDADKLAAYQTLYEVLTTLCRLLAPCIPFLTERMYQNLAQPFFTNGDAGGIGFPISVHLCEYPTIRPRSTAQSNDDVAPLSGDVSMGARFEAEVRKLDENLNWKTQQVQTLVRLGHRLRETAELRVRQPLAELRFACADSRQAEVLGEYREIIADELNVKQVVRAENLDDLVSYVYKPNLKTLGPKYGKLLKVIRQGLPQIDPEQLKPLRNDESVTVEMGGEEITFTPEDLMVSVEQASDWASADEGGIQVALSTQLSEELIQEGMARDMVRHIQQLRKEADLEENQRIRVSWSAVRPEETDAVNAALETWSEMIRAETRADAIEPSSSPDQGKRVSVGEVGIELSIQS
jgi:isoleucyl-tRNA synthetase